MIPHRLPLLVILFFFSSKTVSASLCGHGFTKPCILADTNRDGIVDETDIFDKERWTSRRGAIFLPNTGDTLHRCSSVDLVGNELSNEELAACHDASGDILIAPDLAAPLQTLPLNGLSEDASGRIYIQSAIPRDRVRIFWRQDIDPNLEQWLLVDHQTSFNKTQLGKGINLKLDGRGLVTNAASWDGSVIVRFEVEDGNKTYVDSVALKQAPVLVHHHLQPPSVVLTTSGNTTLSRWQSRFVRAIQEGIADTTSDVPVVIINDTGDIWTQDFFEPAYASMPGPNSTISVRILLRSAQSTRTSGRQVFQQLRGPRVGAFQPGPGSGFGWEEINSGGNIETIPPYKSRSGVRYPVGRVVMGKHFDVYPAESLVAFLDSQGLQKPLFLEAGWLSIGHVDEMVQFLPFDNELGFTIAVADTKSALDLLRKAVTDGHGGLAITTYDGDFTPDYETFFLDPTIFNTTISDLLGQEELLEVNSYAQRHLDKNLELLLEEIPLSQSDVLRIPTLFKDATYPWPAPPDGSPRRLNLAPRGERQLKSLFPQTINGLVLGSTYLAPKPWGPIVNGHDIFEEAAQEIYGRVNMAVVFIDDYMSHHVRGGEVHCGTNTLRNTDVSWWE